MAGSPATWKHVLLALARRLTVVQEVTERIGMSGAYPTRRARAGRVRLVDGLNEIVGS